MDDGWADEFDGGRIEETRRGKGARLKVAAPRFEA